MAFLTQSVVLWLHSYLFSFGKLFSELLISVLDFRK